MLEYPAQVLAVERCEDILIVRMSRPDGYTFRAGQWFRVRMPYSASETRTFSHASAPDDPFLEVATRLSDSTFKQALAKIADGDELLVSDPGGRLTLPQDDRLSLLAGGVGITPIRSLLRDAVGHGRTFDDAALFYGTRATACVSYLAELAEMEKEGVRVIQVVERPDESWLGEGGFINADMVRRHDADGGRTFIVAGPPPMVVAMRGVLDELGVPEDKRIVESFGKA